MRKSFTVHAAPQLALASVALCAAVYSSVPHLPPFADLGVLLGVGFALLFPLHAATIFRSIALEFRTRGVARSKSNQWKALKALPRRVHALLVGMVLTALVLLSGVFSDGSGRQATDTDRGRYYAVDTSDPRRPRIEVTRSEYEALSKQGQRIMRAVYALLVGGGGAVTLVFGKLDDLAGRP
ncbi:hypothetical protein [Streptomyces sp. NPDC008122]|uniref:hypothetical protein n=1 Tax=Streptomyces sp. NPDC008122 TaxID=3364810 RepID=UPI0036DFE764